MIMIKVIIIVTVLLAIKACNTPSTSFLFHVLHDHPFFTLANFSSPMWFGIDCTAENEHPGFHTAITSVLLQCRWDLGVCNHKNSRNKKQKCSSKK